MPQHDSVRFHLRTATQALHERVDQAYGGHDLGDRGAYAAFLTAHARVVAPLERLLAAGPPWREWRPRAALLAADLARLGAAMPAALPVPAVTGDPIAVRWGLLYVLEGSRLGGAMLARRVGAGLPTAYLAAAHRDGSWARFGRAIDAAGTGGGAGWRAAAVDGATLGFMMFADAAMPDGDGTGVVGAAGIEPATPPV